MRHRLSGISTYTGSMAWEREMSTPPKLHSEYYTASLPLPFLTNCELSSTTMLETPTGETVNERRQKYDKNSDWCHDDATQTVIPHLLGKTTLKYYRYALLVPAAAAARWHVMDTDGYWRRQKRRQHINTLNWLPAHIIASQEPGLASSWLLSASVRVDSRRWWSWFHRQQTVLGQRSLDISERGTPTADGRELVIHSTAA